MFLNNMWTVKNVVGLLKLILFLLTLKISELKCVISDLKQSDHYVKTRVRKVYLKETKNMYVVCVEGVSVSILQIHRVKV